MATEQLPDSHLFMVRVWMETAENGQMQYRGRLQHVPSGEIRHFRGCESLPALMLEILQSYTDPEFVLEDGDQAVDPSK